jgi:hypothetical protein
MSGNKHSQLKFDHLFVHLRVQQARCKLEGDGGRTGK